MELNELTFTQKDIIDAAQRILDQAIIQKNGIGIFEELGFGYAGHIRVYVTDDASLLSSVLLTISRNGRTYYLGGKKK